MDSAKEELKEIRVWMSSINEKVARFIVTQELQTKTVQKLSDTLDVLVKRDAERASLDSLIDKRNKLTEQISERLGELEQHIMLKEHVLKAIVKWVGTLGTFLIAAAAVSGVLYELFLHVHAVITLTK